MATELNGQLIQIYYDDAQKVHLYPFAKAYKNKGLTIFFENEVISRLAMTCKAKKFAICSWRLKEKSIVQYKRVRELTQDVMDSDYDVLSFTNNSSKHKMLDGMEFWHPGSIRIFDMMLERAGLSRGLVVANAIYQNHFAARREIYRDYVKTYLIPAMHAMQTDPELNREVMKDSKYTTLTNRNPGRLKELIGVDYYPLAPFLLERLFTVYCNNKNIRVTWL